MLGEGLRAALFEVGREMAVHSRRQQGLPDHVEDAEAMAGFVELWQRPRPHGPSNGADPVITAPTPIRRGEP